MPEHRIVAMSAAAPTITTNGIPLPTQPIRRPSFKTGDGTTKAGWVVDHYWYPDDTEADKHKYRDSFVVLLLIAGYLDAGIRDPSIRELTTLLPKVPTWRIVEIVDGLEREGWIHVERGDDTRNVRNRYSLILQDDE